MPGLLDNSTLLDLFDILVVAVIVYRFAMILKKDTAIRLLVFLIILFSCFCLAQLSGLASTTWLLRTLFSSALVILAIVFQGDVRRAILSIGRRTKDSGFQDASGEAVDELVKAVNDLSKKMIGALIVIVRQIQVDHMLEVGTEIDAKVTSELINSIFLPYSPIHDGAVIINNGKLTRAGCLLPLSRNPDIGKNFGTRHRAALGLSEITDAVMLVVSEETGNISLVHDGKIHYDIESTEIRRMLKKAMEFRRIQKNFQLEEA